MRAVKRQIKEEFYYDATYETFSNVTEHKSANYSTILRNIKEEIATRYQLVQSIFTATQYVFLIFSFLVIIR